MHKIYNQKGKRYDWEWSKVGKVHCNFHIRFKSVRLIIFMTTNDRCFLFRECIHADTVNAKFPLGFDRNV